MQGFHTKNIGSNINNVNDESNLLKPGKENKSIERFGMPKRIDQQVCYAEKKPVAA